MAYEERENQGDTEYKNEEYLRKLFFMLKKRDDLMFTRANKRFNRTEMRMMSELLVAKYENKRLISTQLAALLGITRSAVSQMVQRLETQGVIRRVPDEKDKKIAYVELSDTALKTYGKELQQKLAFMGALVREFGEEKFSAMYQLFDEFIMLAQKKIKDEKVKR